MSKAFDKILTIVGDKGSSLMATDIREIESLITEIGYDDLLNEEPLVWEAIALIVSDPDYEGDIPPVE